MKYQTKTRMVEAITFDELVEYGRSITPQNHLVNGMPWAFEYKGHHVTHENDTCYLILGPETDLRMTPGDMLIAGEHGEIYTCMRDTFEAGYEPAEAGAQQEQPMTFEEWWGGDRDRTLAYDLMKVLTEAAAQAWRAAEAATREELLTQFNRTGVDIDAALHGRVNEKSPIANRLRMIAAAVGPRQPSGYAYRYGSQFGDGTTTIRFDGGARVNGVGPIETIPYWFGSAPPAAAQPKWRPIATAPKDGTEVLLALGDEQAVGDRIGDRGWMTSGGLLDTERLHGEPTHWMPLPEPPND